MNSTDRPFVNPTVILRRDFDDAAILFQPDLGAAIPATGVVLDIWRALDGRRTLAEIADALAAKFDQSPEVILEDTLEFTQDLYRQMFVLTEPLPDASAPSARARRFVIPASAAAPARDPIPRQAYPLTLADGTQFVLRVMDADAARVVTFFAQSAQLHETCQVSKNSQVSVLVATHPFNAPGEIVCLLDPPNVMARTERQHGADGKVAFSYKSLSSEQWLWVQLLQLNEFIGMQIQARGGVLLHSALAARPLPNSSPARSGARGEVGVLLTAQSGVGKTTASNRLPAPWVSLCDDMTLIVRDEAGAYWAHPMPTWSQILRGEKLATWDTQTAVPLRAVFLLRQGETDRVTRLGGAHAIGFLLERAQEPIEYWRENLSLAELGAFNLQLFDNLCRLLHTVPCYLLDARSDGEFWKEMERVLSQ